MAWQGGFKGDGYDRLGFRAWLRQQQKPTFQSFIAVHNTGAPYTLASVGAKQRVINLGNYYKNEKKWKGGPHLFVMEDKVYPGTPINLPTVHSPSWNNISLSIECEGDYDGTHSPLVGKGIVAWDTMSWALAELCDWLDWVPDAKHIRLHREDPATTHACPGSLINKPWLLKKIDQAMAPGVHPPLAPTTAPTPTSVEIVYSPGNYKWSEGWCLPMMKKVEGLRLKAYEDKPGWAIGYGHNSTGKVPPITTPDMVLKDEKEAENILRADLDDKLRYVNAWVKVPLSQGMVDALCMHIFQQGPTQFRNRLLDTINAKQHWTAARKIETMEHANPGVMRRRRLEAARYRGEKPTTW